MNAVQQIALGYAPSRHRAALAALWDYDVTLGRVVATTTEPMIGQMRLTWWRERMIALDKGQVPAEPVLAALYDVIHHYDVTGAMLAAIVEGWEELLEPMPLREDSLRAYAMKRGNVLFDLSARILGSDVGADLGAGWALIDFAAHCSDEMTRKRALSLFKPVSINGPKPLRILARIAQTRSEQLVDTNIITVSRWTILRAVLS